MKNSEGEEKERRRGGEEGRGGERRGEERTGTGRRRGRNTSILVSRIFSGM
jgi:hypothetical protein